jgi:hypothetical protein
MLYTGMKLGLSRQKEEDVLDQRDDENQCVSNSIMSLQTINKQGRLKPNGTTSCVLC